MTAKKAKQTKRASSRKGKTTVRRAGSAGKGKTRATSEHSAKSALYPREGGPRKWLLPVLEEAYTQLVPREEASPPTPSRLAAGAKTFRSRLQPGRGLEILATVGQNVWLDRVREYRERAASAMAVARVPATKAMAHPGAVVAGQKNWRPLGPTVVLEGQAVGNPAVGGRISGMAIAPGGQIVYAASANGGVFRSDDAGQSWRSLMDAFDVDPTNYAATSLACGAIAIDPKDPNRVYVGTGEGDTDQMFRSGARIINALPAYRGIGPIRSDDGGRTWNVEATDPGSPTLAGKAFFALAVDPSNRENVVAATTEGLYQRVVPANGQAQWILRRDKMHSSVVAATAANGPRFIAAEWGGKIWSSRDGKQWSSLGSGFPAANVARITLAVQKQNADLVYAFVSDANGLVQGVYRLDGGNGSWKKIANPPDVLPEDHGASQGDYDLAMAVDPVDANLIYLGGSYYADHQYWPASVWRCRVQAAGANFRFAANDSIGVRAHADVHFLVHSPDEPNELWVGCDGGVFLNRAPRTSDNFGSRNTGLACLCSTFFAQHPTDPNTLFCGLQDNGTIRTRGGSVWKYVCGGDGGYCVVNWQDPKQVLVFANGTIYRTTDGTQDQIDWTPNESFSWASMTEPIVSMPYNPARPDDAKIVALGSGQDVHLSNDFGATWPTTVPVPTAGIIYSLAFASAKRFFAGTSQGEVFRADRAPQGWSLTRLDNAAAGPLGLRGLVSDVAIDWADPSLASIYIAFGGAGDARRVWHFDGTRWLARSGPPGAATGNLLNVEHNALAVDRSNPSHLYVGADIGVWHSADRGQNWVPMPNGLPDAPIFDLQIHPTRRLLRAATHGRGMYEWALDTNPPPQ